MKAFESLLTQGVQVIKAVPVLMNSKQLESYTQDVVSKLKEAGLQFVSYSHLPERTQVTLSGSKETKWEVHSFSLWRWFINVRADGSVYYKNSSEIKTIWRMNKDSGTVDFLPEADVKVNEALNWQKTWLKTGE